MVAHTFNLSVFRRQKQEGHGKLEVTLICNKFQTSHDYISTEGACKKDFHNAARSPRFVLHEPI